MSIGISGVSAENLDADPISDGKQLNLRLVFHDVAATATVLLDFRYSEFHGLHYSRRPLAIDEADAAARHNLTKLNEPSRKSWEDGDAQTIAAFQELAPQIQVTNVPESADGGRLVDADEIAAALRAYREAMQGANLSRNFKIKGFNYNAAAAYHKQQLRKRLERASQKSRPAPRAPMA